MTKRLSQYNYYVNVHCNSCHLDWMFFSGPKDSDIALARYTLDHIGRLGTTYHHENAATDFIPQYTVAGFESTQDWRDSPLVPLKQLNGRSGWTRVDRLGMFTILVEFIELHKITTMHTL